MLAQEQMPCKVKGGQREEDVSRTVSKTGGALASSSRRVTAAPRAGRALEEVPGCRRRGATPGRRFPAGNKQQSARK